MSGGLGRMVGGLGIILALVSCASVSVETGTSRATQSMPELVCVMPFGTHGPFNVDRTGKDLADFKKNLQVMMTTGIVKAVSDKLVPAVPGLKTDWSRHRNNVWIVCGEFTRVNQGSRLLRSAIGFGAGGTKLETKVSVYDLSQNSGTPFLTFTTTGGSGAEPGAVLALSTDPLQLAIGAVSGAAHGLSEDTKRTARMITAELSNYMYERNWIPEDRWIKPKRESGTDVF